MNIRPATLDDLLNLYKIGKNTSELRVSASEEFMDLDEFKWSIENEDCVFLVAEKDSRLVGFILANAKDKDKPFKNSYACLIYLTVMPEYRNRGIGKLLYEECEKRLKEKGINFVYGWANASNPTIITFMEKYGFSKGHQYVWMDKKL